MDTERGGNYLLTIIMGVSCARLSLSLSLFPFDRMQIFIAQGNHGPQIISRGLLSACTGM